MPRVSTKKSARKKAASRARSAGARTVKKAAARKAAPRKAAPKKAAPRAAAPKKVSTPIRESYTKAQLLSALVENTGVAKKDVLAVVDELNSIIERHVKKRAAGQFTMPGLMKIRTSRKPATKARKGRNPFTGEEIMIKAKPARTVVKITALKGLKEMVQ